MLRYGFNFQGILDFVKGKKSLSFGERASDFKAHYGFNFQWMYLFNDGISPLPAEEHALDFMVRFGMDFVRIPLDYRFWVKDFQYSEPLEKTLTFIDGYINKCVQRNMHVCLALHRAPGYCINQIEIERHNLWSDSEAQRGFIAQWTMFAERYTHISSQDLSFDLLNEPPYVGQYGMTRHIHEKLMRQVISAIRAIDPTRVIVVDGLDVGMSPLPELVDLNVIQSGRGYEPKVVTHYQAGWCPETVGLSKPVYPDTEYDGKRWERQTLVSHYQPWVDLQQMGTKVHIGEFGCYNTVENDLALRWFSDLLSVYRQFGWGYSLWHFKGPFGIVEHGRPGTKYEKLFGFKVDRQLLELYLYNRWRVE